MMKMRAILLIFISISSIVQPMHAVKNDNASDISLIKQVTSWLRSGHVTRDTINQVKEFLSHEEYRKCLRDRKTCSKAKFLALVALDAVLVMLLVGLVREPIGKALFTAQLKWKERAIKKAEEKAPLLTEEKKEEFKQIRKDRNVFRDESVYHASDIREWEISSIFSVTAPAAAFFDLIYEGNLKTIKSLVKYATGEPDEEIFALPASPEERQQRINRYKKRVEELKNALTDPPKGYSAIGVAAASHKLDESKKKEIINFLKDEMGIIPTEKDKQMVRLAEWEWDEPRRKELLSFIAVIESTKEEDEIIPALPPGKYKEIWHQAVPGPLLPESSKEKESSLVPE